MSIDLFTSSKNKASFDVHYNFLNEQQQQAVNQTEGPVMVIAGPGTGKTQILAVRIAKILLRPDISAHNILCLTYTDAATIAMRNRLVEIIGPTAHRIHIFSFHGFCNKVIQDNLGYFGDYRQLEPITDLERIELYKQMMLELPNDHPLKKLKQDPSRETKRLSNLFSLMKKENYKEEDITAAVEEYYTQLREDPKMYYTRKSKYGNKGDFKQRDFDKEVAKMDQTIAGAGLFKVYKQMMLKKGRYDFDDMISWVVNAFEINKEILADYQEQYHYFLVDEFQDTNGSQKRILDLLVSYWGQEANVFVVGDDDQAIYKFQGANLGNITDFKEDYNPKVVVLTKNYRSNQQILNTAKQLIEYNQERIINTPGFNLDKNLLAQGLNTKDNTSVNLFSYNNITQEQADIAHHLLTEFKNGKDLSKIAVLYRNHRQVEKLTEVLEGYNVPINIKRRIDILKLPLTQNLLQILTYINESYKVKGYTDRMLFELMHFNFFNISSHDISKLTWETRQLEDKDKFHTPLSTLIGDTKRLQKLELENYNEICNLNKSLDNWIADVNDVTLQILFQNIINQGGVLDYILQKRDKGWQLQVIGTLFDLIKEETTKKPDLKLHEFMGMIEDMRNNDISLPVNKVASANNGVQFLTTHGSKGLEFEKVFVVGLTSDIWDRRRRGMNQFSIPPTLNGDADDNTEDERRLVYVAMTRAKKVLNLVYSIQKENGKDLGPSQFVDELRDHPSIKFEAKEIDANIVSEFQAEVLRRVERDAPMIDKDLVDRKLNGYKLSVTALNKYLECPVTFYFEGILQVPMARTKYLGFGRGVHYAMERIYEDLNEEKKISKEQFVDYFNAGMLGHRAHFTEQEFIDMTVYGKRILSFYFDEYIKGALSPQGYVMEAKIDNVEYEGIPIKGVLDQVEIHKDHIAVKDFKTGNGKSPYTRVKLKVSDGETLGGDYWRQIVFYQILCNADKKHNWNMISGTMDFVEPDRTTKEFTRQKYVVSPSQVEIVGSQIKNTWERIHNYEFEKGCEKEDCHWCNFLIRIKS